MPTACIGQIKPATARFPRDQNVVKPHFDHADQVIEVYSADRPNTVPDRRDRLEYSGPKKASRKPSIRCGVRSAHHPPRLPPRRAAATKPRTAVDCTRNTTSSLRARYHLPLAIASRSTKPPVNRASVRNHNITAKFTEAPTPPSSLFYSTTPQQRPFCQSNQQSRLSQRRGRARVRHRLYFFRLQRCN